MAFWRGKILFALREQYCLSNFRWRSPTERRQTRTPAAPSKKTPTAPPWRAATARRRSPPRRPTRPRRRRRQPPSASAVSCSRSAALRSRVPSTATAMVEGGSACSRHPSAADVLHATPSVALCAAHLVNAVSAAAPIAAHLVNADGEEAAPLHPRHRRSAPDAEPFRRLPPTSAAPRAAPSSWRIPLGPRAAAARPACRRSWLSSSSRRVRAGGGGRG